MSTDHHRILEAILRVLAEANAPLTSRTITDQLQLLGIELRQRMIRYYLQKTDASGWTDNLGRGGRRITRRGLDELRSSRVVDKVGFVAARMDELAYKMAFNLHRMSGTLVVNISRVRASVLPEAGQWVCRVLEAGLGMGRLVAVGAEGDDLGGQQIPFGEIAIGTVCSVTLNGVFRAMGIPVHSRFGGLLELRAGRPYRFTQLIHYEATTVDPVEVFIKGRMTRVREAVETGDGAIGASFREIPAAAIPVAEKLIAQMNRAGLGGVQVLGRPGQPLLNIPVSQGRAGLVVAAGLNAIAAVEEAGIETENHAMAALCDAERLAPAASLLDRVVTSRRLHRRIVSALEKAPGERDDGLFE